MRIAICASMSHAKEIINIQKRGHKVAILKNTEKYANKELPPESQKNQLKIK